MSDGVSPVPGTEYPLTARTVRHDRWRYLLIAFSLANLCLISAWFASLFDNDHGYFNKVPVGSNTLLALLTNLSLLSLVFWTGGLVQVRLPGTRPLAEGALLLLMIVPLDFFRTVVMEMPDRALVTGLHRLPVLLAIVICIVTTLCCRARIARLLASFLLVISPLAVFTVGRILLLLAGLQKIEQDPCLYPVNSLLKSPLPARVIWIVFDELDYRFAFVDRPKGLQIPELDAFRAESFSATHAYPPAGETIASIPALISGVKVISATPRSAADLWLEMDSADSRRDQAPRRTSWRELPSIFSQARSVGANCAIVGWYHPYGRLFADSVSYCEWFPLPKFEPARAPGFLETVQRELCAMTGPFNQRCLHVRNYERSVAAAAALAGTNLYQLVFLHLPVPHKPGIADSKGKLTCSGVTGLDAYVGNVQLANRAFAAIRRATDAAGSWNESWVIVSSDHWWRQGMGNPGIIDHRIPFIVKAPDARKEQYTRPFNTLVTHDLVLAILQRQLKGAEDLRNWLDQHNTPPPYEVLPE